MNRLTAVIKRHGDMLSLVAAAILGLIFPEPGSKGGVLRLDTVTQLGVMLVFFLHGANLAPKNLRQGVTNWRLHLFVQGTTYIFFPLLGALIFIGGRQLCKVFCSFFSEYVVFVFWKFFGCEIGHVFNYSEHRNIDCF